MSDKIFVTLTGDAAEKVIQLSQELGMDTGTVVNKLLGEGFTQKWYKDSIAGVLTYLEDTYRGNLVQLMEKYSELTKQPPVDDPYPEFSKRQVLNEAMTYDTRIEALKDVKDCLKVRGVFT